MKSNEPVDFASLTLDAKSADRFAEAMYYLIARNGVNPGSLAPVLRGVRPEVRRRVERKLGELLLAEPASVFAQCPHCRLRRLVVGGF